MDSRKTAQGDGDEQGSENVVRLPRDWLGPREELVPIGSRAHAADDTPPESMPPTAASFWDEDSGSLQAPMQAPADAWRGRWEPAPTEPPTRAERRRGPLVAGGRARVAAVLGVLATCAAVVLSVIGQTAGGARTAGRTASAAKNPLFATGTGVNLGRLRAHTPVVTASRREPKSHHAIKTGKRSGHARARTHRIHVTTIRRRQPHRARSQPPSSVSEPVRTIASTPTSTPTTTAPSTTTPSSPPVSSAPATSSSSQQPAFGPTGSLGPGSSPDS